MGADMLIQSIGFKATDRFKIDLQWAARALARSRQAVEAIDVARAAAIDEAMGTSYAADVGGYKRLLIADLAQVHAAVFDAHRQAAFIAGGAGIILLLSGGLSWGDPPTKLFDSMSRLTEAEVMPDARWPEADLPQIPSTQP